MKAKTASLRELESNFPRVKRQVDKHGEVIITSNGEPAYIIRVWTRAKRKPAPLPDYYAQLREIMPAPMTEEESRQLHEENRGDR
jgi:antitoxin (DNA-binding transcriptional repressor) of toxin-antitoxin stability system